MCIRDRTELGIGPRKVKITHSSIEPLERTVTVEADRPQMVIPARIVKGPTQGMVVVSSTPPVASQVVIKAKGGAYRKEGESKGGFYQAELPVGSYDVEVNYPKHTAYK